MSDRYIIIFKAEFFSVAYDREEKVYVPYNFGVAIEDLQPETIYETFKTLEDCFEYTQIGVDLGDYDESNLKIIKRLIKKYKREWTPPT